MHTQEQTRRYILKNTGYHICKNNTLCSNGDKTQKENELKNSKKKSLRHEF